MKTLFSRSLFALFLISFSENGSAQSLVSVGQKNGGEIQNFAENPGFELQSVSPGPTGRKRELKSGDRAPDLWNLSPTFPGELEVIESAAPEGNRFVRVTAGKDRAAHIYQGCPKIVRGRVYEISLRYQGGPVELRLYEYDAKGKFVGEPAFAKSRAPSHNSWQEITGYYMLAEGAVKTSLAIVVPPGGKTDLDDLRMIGFKRSSEKLNIRDFGVSGSSFEALAETTTDSPVITVENTGDFQVGHEVIVSQCNSHFSDGLVWAESSEGTRERDFQDQVELRGYDGSAGDRASYILDFKGETPPVFRWSDDLGQSWKEPVKVTGDWQKLNAGIEVKLPNTEFWRKARLISFTACNHLLSRVEKIEGQTLTLAHPVPLTAKKCVVQHSDSGPLQRAFDRPVGERRNIYIPIGHYRLSILVDGPILDAFDPDNGVFRLLEDFELKPNAVFVLRAPQGFSWSIHHNIISDCAQAVKLNVFGGATAVFSDNVMKRGQTSDGSENLPAEILGQFTRTNNIYSGIKIPE